jgi:hypothetical protein
VSATALVGTALVIAPTAWLLSRSKATSKTPTNSDAPPEAPPALPPEPKTKQETKTGSFGSPIPAPQLRL